MRALTSWTDGWRETLPLSQSAYLWHDGKRGVFWERFGRPVRAARTGWGFSRGESGKVPGASGGIARPALARCRDRDTCTGAGDQPSSRAPARQPSWTEVPGVVTSVRGDLLCDHDLWLWRRGVCAWRPSPSARPTRSW